MLASSASVECLKDSCPIQVERRRIQCPHLRNIGGCCHFLVRPSPSISDQAGQLPTLGRTRVPPHLTKNASRTAGEIQ